MSDDHAVFTAAITRLSDFCQHSSARTPWLPPARRAASDTLSVKDVAARYGVTVATVTAWIRAGELKAVNTSRTATSRKPRWRVTPAALAEFEALRGAAPPKPEDTGKLGPPATYSVLVPDALRSDWGVGDNSVVYLSLAATSTKPGPRTPPKDPKKEEEEKAAEEKKASAKAPKPPPAPKEPPKPKEKPDETPVDLSVELVDTAGRTAKLPLSQFGIARKPLDSRIYRRAGRDASRFTNIYELIPQTFVMPVADFAAAAPGFDPRQLATIRLVFDKTEAGTVIVEHIGLSTPSDPAFLAAPIPAGTISGAPVKR